MYKLLLYFLFSTLLFSQTLSNPKPYAALGDVIYNNVAKIEAMQDIDAYKLYGEDIKEYLNKVYYLKEQGYGLEKGVSQITKREYLKRLRGLSKENDMFLRVISASYSDAMRQKEYDLFSTIINKHLIDTEKNKEQIIEYYFAHQEDINSSGVIDEFLEEDAKLKAQREAKRRSYKTKKELEAEKIKRIRERDRAAKERLERRLQEELIKKKLMIREKQKRELSN